MSHSNLVFLHGTFHIIRTGLIEFEGKEFLEVEAKVQTGLESHGEVHRVNLMSEAAEIAEAFVEANGGDGMLVTVQGKLYSMKERSRVVVDYVTFYVPKHVEKKSKLILEQINISKRGTGFSR